MKHRGNGVAQRKGKRKDNRLPPFVALTWNMLNHPAYKQLPSSAAKALPYFLGKVKINGNDPDRFSTIFEFSYTEAEAYGFARGSFGKIITDLMGHGFIDPIAKGGLRGLGKSSSQFSLSRRWENYGTDDYKEMTWKQIIFKSKI
jgi:hypothetical protein